MPLPVLLIILLTKRLVLIRENLFVDIQQILLCRQEVPPTAVLAFLVDELRNAQQLRHLLLVVNQVAPFQPSLEDHLQSIARGRDKRHQDANLLEVKMCDNLSPILACRLPVVALYHVVEIQHRKSVQTNARLLSPSAYHLLLIRQLQVVRDEDHQRQCPLHPIAISLHLLLV